MSLLAALQAFHRDQEFSDLRQARLVCFGCIDPVLPDNAKLIEDGQRFPKLLSSVEAYRADPRAFRRCYRGLLYGYFGYNAEKARSAGKQNWMLLRTYLRERVADTVAPGWSPPWVEALRAKAHLLTDNPAEAYGRTLLVDGDEEFDLTRKALDIHDDSWLVWSVVLGQIEAASKESDEAFQAYLPKLLDLLDRHPLARNVGLTKLLGRYCVCNPALVHPRLTRLCRRSVGHPMAVLECGEVEPGWRGRAGDGSWLAQAGPNSAVLQPVGGGRDQRHAAAKILGTLSRQHPRLCISRLETLRITITERTSRISERKWKTGS